MTQQEHLSAKLDGMGIPALSTLRTGRDAISAIDMRAQDVIDDIAEVGGSAVAADTQMAHKLIGIGLGAVVVYDQAPSGIGQQTQGQVDSH